MVRAIRVVLVVLAAAALLAGSVSAAHWVVAKDGSGTHLSVHGAMNDASAGDTIYVQPGIYDGRIDFVNGVTVVGAGAGHTILRHGYGFEAVVFAKNTSSGRLEGVTIERLPSVLAAPAVVLDSSSLTFIDCTIKGGQGAGVEVFGLSAAPVFEGCLITGHEGHGIWVRDNGEAILRQSEVSENASNGILCENGTVRIESGSIEGNALSGLVLVAGSSGFLASTQLVTNERWGLEAHDESDLDVRSVDLLRNGIGGLSADGAARVTLDRVDVLGGMEGLRVEDAARLSSSGGSICEVRGSGVRVLDEASGTVERVEILSCEGDGIELLSNGESVILHCTIARNDGDGIHADAGSLIVRNTILSLNRGAGIRAGGSAAVTSTSGYNAVWGNAGGDYIGTGRRSSDTSESPGLSDPSDGDASLRDTSPCIGSGQWSETIGAAVNPLTAAGARITVDVAQDLPPTRWTLGSDIRVEVSLVALEEGRIRLDGNWPRAELAIDASLIGPSASWMSVDGSYRPGELTLARDGSSSLALAVGGDGMLDASASYVALWGAAVLEGEMSRGQLRLEQEWPSRISRQWIDLEFERWHLDFVSTDLVANRLDLSANTALPLAGEAIDLQGGLTLIPDPRLSLDASWGHETWRLSAGLRVFLEDIGVGSLELGWEDREANVDVRVHGAWAALALADLGITASWRSGALEVGAEAGIDAIQGARFRVRIGIDTTRWLTPQPNEPPVARFTSSPHEPEAGKPVLFDASASFDPDGTIDQTWWEFDGTEFAIGDAVEHVFSTAGEHVVTLTVSDADGAATMLVETIVIWEANTAPAASFVWSAISEGGIPLDRPARVGDRIRLDASSSFDPDGTIVEYNWDLESDGVFDATTREPFLVIDPFLSGGARPVTLRVIDDTNRSDAVMHVLDIDEPRPPLAAFDLSPTRPSLLDPVRFVDRSIAGDEGIVAWAWDFGDGGSSREQEPIHRFAAEGDIDVTLTVTDAAGRSASTVRRVNVGRVPGVVEPDEVWALIIGVSDYAEVEDLDYASRDAMAMADWLSSAGVPPDHVRTLTDGKDGLHPPATLVAVREGLGWLRQQADADDLVLVHFSGHGYQGADDNGDEADGVDEFLALQDTRSAARDDTALRDDEFGRFLDRIESNHVLVFFDSCYSGGLSRSLVPGARSATPVSDWLGDLKLEGRLVLSASAEGEEAFESPALEHGVFTHYLLQGLNGMADLNADYRVTLWELYEYVASEVPEHVLAERDEPQHPQLRGEGETRVLLSLEPQPAEIGVSYCPTIPYAGGTLRFSAHANSTPAGAEWRWEFGDGATATGREPAHAYRDAGRYALRVVLRVGGAEIASRSLAIEVSPAGSIVALDAGTETATLSLGRRNGLRTMDRFVVERTGVAIEVIELIDEDRAICSILDPGAALSAGDVVRPTTEGTCNPSGE